MLDGHYIKFHLLYDDESEQFVLTINGVKFEDLQYQVRKIETTLNAIERGKIYLNEQLVNPDNDGWMTIEAFKQKVA